MNLRKKNFIVFISVISFIYILYQNFNYSAMVCMTPVLEDGEKIILIDPGHGGIDGGAETKRGTVEKNINLSISLKLRDRLKNMGYNVIMTREEDKGLYTEDGSINKKKIQDLNNRCKIKRESNCDIFISIHQNFFTESYYHGAQVWYSKSEDSEKLAHIIQENLREDLDKKNKRIEKSAGNSYKILRCYCNTPSVIVECGFLTNNEEEKKLINDEYQNKIADSLVKSIQEYFGDVEDVVPYWRRVLNKL